LHIRRKEAHGLKGYSRESASLQGVVQMKWFIKSGDSFKMSATDPLRDRWAAALRDPAYLALWAGLFIILAVTALAVI
jgi:hypothetical protein